MLRRSPPPPVPPITRFGIGELREAFGTRETTPRAVVRDVLAAIDATGSRNPAWICVVPPNELLHRAADLEEQHARGKRMPLYGVPFAVKDNIDVVGVPTTAACPAFRYVPRETADAVAKLEQAGAIFIGKTNMDQFATGLVGTRSPYGACSNPFDSRYISGGSSSGSAVAVALGHVAFALGTDTAGSGRVPAAFCNLVGLKPTRGLVSLHGVLPACRSLDCMSVFAHTVEDAAEVFDVIAGFDPSDPYSRKATPARFTEAERAPTCGVVRASQLQFFGDDAARKAYEHVLESLTAAGLETVEIDYTPFADVARLLYEGPWLAERLAAIKEFYERSAREMHPVVRQIISGGARFSAVETFEAQYRLQSLARRAAAEWSNLDMLLLPTAGTIYRIEEVLAESDPAQHEPRLLHQFREPAGSLRARRPGGLPGRWAPLRPHLHRTRAR